MATPLTQRAGLAPYGRMRHGKYDPWLDGRMWELAAPKDAAWFGDRKRLLRALRGRARRRGLSLRVVKPEGSAETGRIVVQAVRP